MQNVFPTNIHPDNVLLGPLGEQENREPMSGGLFKVNVMLLINKLEQYVS